MKFHILILITAGMMLGCKDGAEEPSTETEMPDQSHIELLKSQYESSGYVIGPPTKNVFDTRLRVKGFITVPEKGMATASSLISGQVGNVKWRKGEWVSRGQVLFTVSNPELIDLQERYLVARDQISYLKENYDREQKLYEENLTTKNTMLKAKADLESTQASYEAMRAKLKLFGIDAASLNSTNLVSAVSVVAPISGYITEILINRGQYINQEMPAIRILNKGLAQLELSILSKDVAKIERGQKVTFQVSGDAHEIYEAEVSIINPGVGEDHMIQVYCTLIGPAKKLVPGMYADAALHLDNTEYYALPESAVVAQGDEKYALVLLSQDEESMHFEKITLKEGAEKDGHVQLVDTTYVNKDFLLEGAYYIIQ